MTTACPACVAIPDAPEADLAGTVLSLPGIHCAGCIGTVERALLATPGVKAARVNLSRKRVTVDAPGVSAATLRDVIAGVGYEALPLEADLLQDNDAAGQELLWRIAVAGFAMMNVMLFSVAVWSGASEATQEMFHWISAAVAIPALVYSAQVFVLSGWSALRVGRLNMDVPIGLAIILAAGLSVYETATGGKSVYFDAALSLTFFLLIGRYLDHRTRVAARSAAQELSALENPFAERLTNNLRETVKVGALSVGDTIAVMVGMRVPVDGIVLTGRSDMDRSVLTGESLAVPVGVGDAVAAGEVNLTGPLTLRVTATGEATTLRRMAALVEIAEASRNRYTALADRAAQIYAPLVHLLAFATFVGWVIVSGDVARSINIAIAVLIITCPCALGLAVPAVMTAASGRLFRRGMLVKTGTALERLAEVDTVVFDKTGTLTEGHVTLEMDALPKGGAIVLAALAAASSHPVSRAIALALPRGTEPADLDDIVEVPGQGVQGVWNGQVVRLGRASWVGTDMSPGFAIADRSVSLQFHETLRDGAAMTVAALQGRGLDVQLLTGDTANAAAQVAQALGIATVHSGVLPADKQARIAALGAAGHRVLMIGDGLNDTGALAAAHASISPASALDASRAASDIVILGRSLAEVPDAVATAVSARKRVIENFAIAAGYNMIAVPLAIAGFATPLSAAIAMSASSITVLLNALRVR